MAPPERLRAFRSPRSYNPLFQPVEIWGGLLGAAFPRPWPEYGKKFAGTVTLQQALKWARRMYLGALLSVSQVPVEPALERRRRTCRSWTAQHQRTAGSPAGRASARARVVNCWPRRLSRSATELLPRRAGHAYSYGAGTLDGTGARAGRAGSWEPQAPGLGFCWDPELEGPTSPSSTWSSTPR